MGLACGGVRIMIRSWHRSMRAFQSPSDLRPRRIYQVTIACCVKLLCIKTKQQLSSYDLRCTFLWKYDLLCMHACMQTRLAPECALEQPRAVLWAELPGWACARWSKVGRKRPNRCHTGAVFSFLYLKKVKISKIYIGFGKFQKYTPAALWGRQGSKIYIRFKFEEKKITFEPCRPPIERPG